jgi:tRNA(Ile)-lysidine synthase
MALTPIPLEQMLAGRCPPHRRLWIAYSGGLDSTVLLHLAHLAGLKPKAVHVNHQLQPAASAWAEHCRSCCARWRIPLELKTVSLAEVDPAGPEAAARLARYAAMRELMQPGDLLATAHHRGDQAETVLMRLLRGTGVSGLAAMAELAVFAPGQLWRPLLKVPRELLRAHAQRHQLAWIEDPQNADPRYTRSWLRAEILPRLRERWPAAEESLSRASAHAAESRILLQELAEADLAPATCGVMMLSVAALLAMSLPRRRNLLRHWIVSNGFEVPAADMLERVDAEVLRARPDAEPLLTFGNAELRRYRDVLHLMSPLPPAPEEWLLIWKQGARLELPAGCGVLEADVPPVQPLTIGFPRGGEKIRVAGSSHRRTLKNLFQEAGIPPWQRLRTPLLWQANELFSVADQWETEAAGRLRADHGFSVRWRHELRSTESVLWDGKSENQ